MRPTRYPHIFLYDSAQPTRYTARKGGPRRHIPDRQRQHHAGKLRRELAAAWREAESRSSQRKKVWEAFQARGERVRPKILELVRLRNQAARKLGYADYYEMQLRLMELNIRARL